MTRDLSGREEGRGKGCGTEVTPPRADTGAKAGAARRTSKVPILLQVAGAAEGPRQDSGQALPFSRPVISTESREGGMALVARIQSPTFFSFLYSTRKDWMGKPPFPRGIQVTYTDVSEAMEIVGLSGASGAGEAIHEERRKQEGHDWKIIIRVRLDLVPSSPRPSVPRWLHQTV